jgi:hypothetical protein
MKKDIPFPKVEDIALAVVKEKDDITDVWNVYLINMKPTDIKGVLVASKGYGEKDGEKIKTSTLRHFFDQIPPASFVKVEQIMDNLLGISNEFWVSFYLGTTIFDKKYVFLAESIQEANLTNVPILNKQGVIIK